MSSLPNLNPTQNNISWFAYYDVSDQVDSQVYDETELNNAANAGGFTDSVTETGGTYDNGVIFSYRNDYVNRDITIRAGSNQKISAHIKYKGYDDAYDSPYSTEYLGDNTTQDGTKISDLNFQSNDNGLNGDYDLLEWTRHNQAPSITDNILFKAINDCIDSTNWSSEINVDRNNMNLNNYRFSEYTNVSIFSSRDSGGSFSYKDGTTIKKVYLTYFGYGNNWCCGSHENSLGIEGDRLLYTTGTRYGAMDITDIVRNNQETGIQSDTHGRDSGTKVCSIVIWQ